MYKQFYILCVLVGLSSVCPCAGAQCPHHLFLGAQVTGFNLNTSIYDLQVRGNRTFYGLALGYEYVRPCAPYGGFDLFSTIGSPDFQASLREYPLTRRDDDTWFGHSEFRLGYTFAPNQYWYSSPYLGVGGYLIDPFNHSTTFEETFPYFALGAKTRMRLGRCQTLGLNLKAFSLFHASKTYWMEGRRLRQRHHGWGGEIGIPYTLSFGCRGRWSLEVEPFFLTLDFSETQDIYGGRLSLQLAF